MTKKERERRFCELFLKARPELPPGYLTPYDPPLPDIGYACGDTLIAIELTELHGRESLRREEGEQEAILRRAQSICEENGSPRVWVSVSWANGFLADKRLREPRARQVAALVTSHLPSPGQWVGLGDRPEAPRLDDSLLEALWIERIVDYSAGENSWVSEYSWWHAHAEASFIQAHIDRKRGRRALYPSQFTGAWLVMTVRGSAPSSGFTVDDGALASSYRSEYDRVFLFEVLRGAAHELSLRSA